MDAFLEEGKRNPHRERNKKGFLSHFAAWLIEEDLPWTTGEAPSLKRLFKYTGSKFELPSDTTVRDTVRKIFAELHDNVVTELAVRLMKHLSACC